jgi:hypothetical protein
MSHLLKMDSHGELLAGLKVEYPKVIAVLKFGRAEKIKGVLNDSSTKTGTAHLSSLLGKKIM